MADPNLRCRVIDAVEASLPAGVLEAFGKTVNSPLIIHSCGVPTLFGHFDDAASPTCFACQREPVAITTHVGLHLLGKETLLPIDLTARDSFVASTADTGGEPHG